MFVNALRLVAAPLLLWQGRQTFKTMVPLPEPQGERWHDRPGVGKPLRLLVLGDSAAAGVGVATQTDALFGRLLANLQITRPLQATLVAKHGATTAGTLRYLERDPPGVFDVAVIVLGGNDMIRGLSIAQWRDRYLRLVDWLRRHAGVQHFVVCGQPPMGEFPGLPQPMRWFVGRQAKAYSQALATMAANDCELTYFSILGMDRSSLVDGSVAKSMASDGFHPGPPIYTAWGAALAQTLGRLPAVAVRC